MTPSARVKLPPLPEDAHLPDSIGPGEALPKKIYVYELPVRIWHWGITLAIIVLSITGYFIGAPLPTVQGEASDNWVMGYVRAIHFMAGYLLCVAMVARTYHAVVGNRYSRQIFMMPILSRQFWNDAIDFITFYMFINNKPRVHMGHNPVARMSMFGFMVLAFWMCVSGLALYGEGAGIESWQYQMFAWCFSLAGSSMYLHTLHHLGMWGIILFVCIHLYAVFREEFVGHAASVSVMISGWRIFRQHQD